jgi:peptide/nickel transport system substrate-binding protein
MDGDYKVRFKLKYPWGSFLAELAIWLEIVNEKGINAADPKLNPIGTGPYKMTEWVQDDHIRLDRWENYHIPDRPYLDSVIFRSIPDDTVRLTGLQTNELQWIQQVPLLNAEQLRADEGDDLQVTAASPYLPDFLYLNGSKPPFDDARVRQAVAVASQLSPYYTGQNPWANGPDYEKAKQLLAEAGAEGLTFDFDGQPQVATQIKIAQVIQQQLSQAGITMNIQNYESGEWITRLNTLEYSATVTYYSVTIDPVQFYNRKLRSDGKGNNTGYKSPEMDQLLDAWVGESDTAKRAEAYAKVVDLAQRDAAVLPLDHQAVQYWSRVNLAHRRQHNASVLTDIGRTAVRPYR